MSRRLMVLSAPSNLGLMPPPYGDEPGVRRLAEVLKRFGLVRRLEAHDAGTVAPPQYRPERDRETGVRNSRAIRDYSLCLADAVQPHLAQGHFCLVLGGDCSILLGSMLALRRMGRYGLIFIDGHRDFQTPAMSATGGAAGMDLALATGRGPEVLTRYDGFEALVEEGDVVIAGHRDAPDSAAARALAGTTIQPFDLAALRQLGVGRVAQAALGRMQANQVDGFWIHVDVDVLESAMMPAVDSPQADGLSYDELRGLLVPLLRSPLVAGMEVTIYDPERDRGGEVGRQLAGWLVELLGVVNEGG